MIAKCKEKVKTTSSYIQNCGYTMPRALNNSISKKCQSNSLMKMSIAT
jgi:hypothetical protein